jgi:hypothetical protein
MEHPRIRIFPFLEKLPVENERWLVGFVRAALDPAPEAERTQMFGARASAFEVVQSAANADTGYATDGGFPFQMKALSELFDETRVLVPCYPRGNATGEIALDGHNLRVVPLSPRRGTGLNSKLNFLPWLLRNSVTIWRELRRADGVHAPIPGDVGTVGMLGACFLRKPLLVRHCGNWLRPVTLAEKFWRWFMEAFAGGRNIMLATGGADEPPSRKSSNVQWIFSSSLRQSELQVCAKERTCPR